MPSLLPKPAPFFQWTVYSSLFLFAFTLFILLSGCHGQSSVAVSKDLNTGMVTTSRGLSTATAKMVMNDEVLNHTDIPLGESFFIINEGIKGYTVKEGKVSIGCSLLITDTAGKVLLDAPDLFKGNDLFDKDKAALLRCKVNTGKPMNWQEKYHVQVVFTDKYGKGSIENKVAINMIDEP